VVQINEISLRTWIDRATLVAFMSRSLGVDVTRIVTSEEYWELERTGKGKAIGLEVFLSDAGFRTLCRWYQQDELSPADLLMLATKASVAFQTDTVIANCIEPSDASADQFLLVTPERKFYRAYATVNSLVFEIALIDEKELSLDSLTFPKFG